MENKKPYNDKERVLLACLVRDHAGVLENKQTDGTTLQQKQRAWEVVTVNYNIQPEISSPRTAKQLKKLWDNMKQRKRKEITEQKHNQLLTGGGSLPAISTDPVLDLVDVAAPYVDVTLDCPWDSTAVLETDRSQDDNEAMIHKSDEGDFVVTPSQQILATPSANRSGKRFKTKRTYEDDEKYWRVLKAKEAVQQQREFHKKRMEGANAETELALLRLAEFKKTKIVKVIK